MFQKKKNIALILQQVCRILKDWPYISKILQIYFWQENIIYF
jgi:hypothetical protein